MPYSYDYNYDQYYYDDMKSSGSRDEIWLNVVIRRFFLEIFERFFLSVYITVIFDGQICIFTRTDYGLFQVRLGKDYRVPRSEKSHCGNMKKPVTSDSSHDQHIFSFF